MKTQEELEALKKECEDLDSKLVELTYDELGSVTGGLKLREDFVLGQSLKNTDEFIKLNLEKIDNLSKGNINSLNKVNQLEMILGLKERLSQVDDVRLKEIINDLKRGNNI